MSVTRKRKPALNLSEFLPYRLSILANKISKTLSSLYAEQFNLAIPEWRIMAVLGQYPSISADEICKRTEMDKVTVSRSISKLLEKKYITRMFSKDDRRRSILKLSKRGNNIYTQIIPLALDYEANITAVLSKAELNSLDKIIGKLDSNLETLK